MMRTISLDASGWRSPNDFYLALYPELGAPAWLAPNLNSFQDSLYGGIYTLEAPFKIYVHGKAEISSEMITFLEEISNLFAESRIDQIINIEFFVI